MNRASAALLFLAAGILAACGRAERKVRIAVIADLTGPNFVILARESTARRRSPSRTGSDALRAAGWDVNLAAFDAAGTSPDLGTTARNIAADPDTACAIVRTGSVGNFAAAEIFHAAGIASILPAETSPLPDPASLPNTIFLSPDDRSHGASDAEWVLSRGDTRILVTTDADPRALAIAGGFRDAAQSGGARSTPFRSNPRQDLSDWTAYAQSIHPDLMYFSGSSQLALSLLDQMTASGLRVRFSSPRTSRRIRCPANLNPNSLR